MNEVTPYLRKLHDEHMARRARLFPAKSMEVVTEPERMIEIMSNRPEPEPEPEPPRFKQPFFTIISDNPIEPQPIKSPSVRDIQIAACRFYGVKLPELLSVRRHAQIVRARQVAMYLAKTLTLRSLPEIGRRFGGKDHTTVLHAVRKIDSKRAADAVLDAQILELTAKLKPTPDAMD